MSVLTHGAPKSLRTQNLLSSFSPKESAWAPGIEWITESPRVVFKGLIGLGVATTTLVLFSILHPLLFPCRAILKTLDKINCLSSIQVLSFGENEVGKFCVLQIFGAPCVKTLIDNKKLLTISCLVCLQLKYRVNEETGHTENRVFSPARPIRNNATDSLF